MAWNDSSAGSLDVALRKVGPSLGLSAPLTQANGNLPGAQQDPDLVWTGSELVAAWTEGLELKYRRFTAELTPLGDEARLGGGELFGANVALTGFGASWAAAWRAFGFDGSESLRIKAGNVEWSVGPFRPGASQDRPALVELDSERLLVVFTHGTDPLGTGTSNVSRLRGAVLDVNAPGTAEAFDILPTVEPWASDPGLAESRPGLARVGTRVYLCWQSESPLGDSRLDEVWLRELEWDGTQLGILEEHPLQIDSSRDANQRAPALAATPLGPEGALLTLWEDSMVDPRHDTLPDIMVGLRPSPIVVLPAPRRGR